MAMLVCFPIFHRLHTTDNMVIIISCLSQIAAAIIRGFATEVWHFYLSAAVDMGTALVSPPIRAQLSHCVEPHELGKVFAMLASVESLIPIIGTNMYTNIYKATRELAYPLPGTCYFVSCVFIGVGLVLTTAMACSLSCRKIPPAGKARLERGSSNRHPEDNSKGEIMCQTYEIRQNF